MSQSRLGSFTEACLNTASGFVVSLLVWQYLVAPLFRLPISWHANFGITGIFTVVSVVRSYFWRRFMDWLAKYWKWLRAAD